MKRLRLLWVIEMNTCVLYDYKDNSCPSWEPVDFALTREYAREAKKAVEKQRDGNNYRIRRYVPVQD
jgi:hypothetical protein